MRLLLIFIGLSLSFSAQAEAPWIGLPGHQSFSSYSREKRMIYVMGLQDTLVAVSSLHNRTYKYETRKARVSFPWMNEAFAAQGKCDYAGYIQTLDANGKCPPPSKGDCKNPDQVQCNPVYFGYLVCVPQSGDATSMCKKASKPPKEIADAWAKDKVAYQKVNDELGSYCAQGLSAPTCGLLREHISDVNRAAGNPATPPLYTPTVGADGAIQGYTTPIKPGDALPPQKPVPGRSTVGPIPGAVPAGPSRWQLPDGSFWEESANESGDLGSECQTGWLINKIRCGVKDPKSKEANRIGLFDVDEAQDLFCKKKKLSADQKKMAFERLEKLESCMENEKAHGDATYQLQATEDTEFVKKRMRPNLEKCFNNPPGKGNGSEGTLTKQGDQVIVKAGAEPVQTGIDHAGDMLVVKKISLCSVRLVGFSKARSGGRTSGGNGGGEYDSAGRQ